MIAPEIVARLISYDPETGILTWRRRGLQWFRPSWCHTAAHAQKFWNNRYADKVAFTSRNSDGYLSGCILRQSVKAHRVAWCVYHGNWPTGHIDHINGDRSDNRIANLRDVTKADNCQNHKLHAANRSGFNGVNRRGRRWTASVRENNNRHWLGTFDSFEEAVEARRRANRKYGFHPNHGLRRGRQPDEPRRGGEVDIRKIHDPLIIEGAQRDHD